VRLERAAIKDTDRLAPAEPEPVDQPVADGLVHRSDFFQRRGTAGADGPDRFIGHFHLVRAGGVRNRAGQLLGHHRFGLARVALRLGFADADDRVEPGPDGGLGLGAYDVVGFAVVGAPLRMADNDELRTGIGHHGGGDVTGVSTRSGPMTILATGQNAARRTLGGHGGKQRRGRADDDDGARGLARGQEPGQFGQFVERVRQPVHLPVSGDQR